MGLFIILLCLFSVSISYPVNTEKFINRKELESNSVNITLQLWFGLYRKFISPARGNVCNFTPTCSQYAEESIKQYGLLKGIIMATDRLQRCNYCISSAYYPIIELPYRGPVYYDPVIKPKTEKSNFILCSDKNITTIFETSTETPKTTILGFALNLYKNKEYSAAIIELNRFLYLYPENPVKDMIFYMIGMCYTGKKEWEKSIPIFRNVISNYPKGKFVDKSQYRLAECYYNLGDFERAVTEFEKVETDFPESSLKDDARFMCGLCFFLDRNWDNASNKFNSLLKDYPDSKLVPAAEKLINKCEKSKYLKYKSHIKSAILSTIIPGTGQIYAHRTGDGISSFFINAILFGLTADRFNNKDITAGWFLGIVSFSFYIGNIYGATNSAINYNQKLQSDFLNESIQEIMPILIEELGQEK